MAGRLLPVQLSALRPLTGLRSVSGRHQQHRGAPARAGRHVTGLHRRLPRHRPHGRRLSARLRSATALHQRPRPHCQHRQVCAAHPVPRVPRRHARHRALRGAHAGLAPRGGHRHGHRVQPPPRRHRPRAPQALRQAQLRRARRPRRPHLRSSPQRRHSSPTRYAVTAAPAAHHPQRRLAWRPVVVARPAADLQWRHLLAAPRPASLAHH